MTITTEFWFDREISNHLESGIADLVATMQLAFARDITETTQEFHVTREYNTDKVIQVAHHLAPAIKPYLLAEGRLFISNENISIFDPSGELTHTWYCRGSELMDVTEHYIEALQQMQMDIAGGPSLGAD